MSFAMTSTLFIFHTTGMGFRANFP